MKIHEITEGYTNENWATGALGAAGRAIQRGGAALGAKMGIGKYQGVQKVPQATMGVYKNFQRYLGQTGSEPTVAALGQYLKAIVPARSKAPDGMRWVPLATVQDEALPNLMRKVIAHGLSS